MHYCHSGAAFAEISTAKMTIAVGFVRGIFTYKTSNGPSRKCNLAGKTIHLCWLGFDSVKLVPDPALWRFALVASSAA